MRISTSSIMPNEYQGYELNDGRCCYELTKREVDALEMGIYLIDYEVSISTLAIEFMCSKTKVHTLLREVLPNVSSDMESVVDRVLNGHRCTLGRSRLRK